MILLSESRNRINIPTNQFLNNLKAGEHGCVFYLSKEEMQMIHFAFVKSGLENNWGVVYATATESIDEVRNAMQSYGINTRYYEKEEEGNGSLIIIRGEDLYKNADNPDIENWINSTKSVSDMFISKGKKGVRVAADLSSYFLSRGLIEQWLELEYALERKVSLPISILCAYDVRFPEVWDTDILKYYLKINSDSKEFVDAHSFAIYTSRDKSITFTI
jgi:MEDS: MEthanogen/methylotroph, DcmR Sensory domain